MNSSIGQNAALYIYIAISTIRIRITHKLLVVMQLTKTAAPVSAASKITTVLSEMFVGLYFHDFSKWLQIREILSANFPEQLENGSRNCLLDASQKINLVNRPVFCSINLDTQ